MYENETKYQKNAIGKRYVNRLLLDDTKTKQLMWYGYMDRTADNISSEQELECIAPGRRDRETEENRRVR
jgi:hypothetical protein